MERLGLYVSVPFCRAKCSFCNFASGVSTADRVAEYVRRLCAEIDSTRGKGSEPGGWPASCGGYGVLWRRHAEPAGARATAADLRSAAREFAVEQDAEITLEAAPGQIADGVLEEAMRLGVNRVSLGVQSFVDRESAAVGRTHTGESCLREIATAARERRERDWRRSDRGAAVSDARELEDIA